MNTPTLRATFTRLLLMTAIASPAAAAAQDGAPDAEPEEEEVLDREFMIGPRLVVGALRWSREATRPDEGEPALLGLELDMRKEFGFWAVRMNVGLHLRADFSDGEVLLVDVGSDFYIINAPTSLYAGPYVGLRLSEGPNSEHTALAVGPVFGGRLGVMFRRHRPTRFYVEAQAGFAPMFYNEGLLDEVTPPSYNAIELLVSTGVGF